MNASFTDFYGIERSIFEKEFLSEKEFRSIFEHDEQACVLT
jgi:hypothetical protein